MNTHTRPMPWLLGRTGGRKTALGLLASCCYGTFHDEGDLLTWGATYASWEVVSHILKDMLLVLDDYKSATADGRYVTKFVQHYSDSAGRQRRRPDLSAMPSKRPRGVILATGEECPTLQASVAARILYIPVKPDDVRAERDPALPEGKSPLDLAQAASGNLPGLTIGFVRWVADHPEVRDTLGKAFTDGRAALITVLGEATNTGRIASNVAQLVLAKEVRRPDRDH